MQSAGEICTVCQNPISAKIASATCPHCQGFAHTICLENIQGTCPRCSNVVIKVEAPAPPSPPSSPLQFIEGELERPKTSNFYRLSLTLVSAVMLLILASYAVLIGLLLVGVVYYAAPFRWV